MDIIRRLIAEFIGTFALVFAGVGAVIASSKLDTVGLAAHPVVTNTDGHAGLILVALSFGLVIAVMVCAIGHISGAQFNPAVSIALLATGKQTAHDTLFYVLIQLVAGVAAAGVLQLLYGGYSVAGGVTMPAVGMTPLKAMWIEFILTFFLVFVIFGVAVDKRGPAVIAGFSIGLTVALDIMIGGPFTGASMNPARTFGPALIGRKWDYHWVYWAGPILGGAVAAVVYNSFFLMCLRNESKAGSQMAG
jgi:MIP family channel proteins